MYVLLLYTVIIVGNVSVRLSTGTNISYLVIGMGYFEVQLDDRMVIGNLGKWLLTRLIG